MTITQISVFLENKAGRLWEAAEALKNAGINIRALSLADTSDFGVLRLIVDRPDEAFDALRQKGFSTARTEVLAVEVPDRPGGLADLLRLLTGEKINVEYVYAFAGKKEGNAVVVLRVEEPGQTASVLQRSSSTILTADDIARL